MPHLHFPHVTLNIRSIYFGLIQTLELEQTVLLLVVSSIRNSEVPSRSSRSACFAILLVGKLIWTGQGYFLPLSEKGPMY